MTKDDMVSLRTANVSVVIPSYQRHDAIIRAVNSALSQTLSPLEVIVCNDGADAQKGHLLAALKDPRVVFIEAPRRGSASATRNYGIRQARGKWIALLDDDDTWVDQKIELQLAACERMDAGSVIVAGVEKVYEHGGSSHIRPSKPVPLDTPVDKVLFCGYGGAHTSTLLAPAELFRRYPFDETIERHEDWKWLLQAGQDAELIVVPEVVCIRRLTKGEGLSRPGGFNFSKSWYQSNKKYMSAESRSRFVTRILARKAAHDKDILAIRWLMQEVRQTNGLTLAYIIRILMPWCLSQGMRNWIKLHWDKGHDRTA